LLTWITCKTNTKTSGCRQSNANQVIILVGVWHLATFCPFFGEDSQSLSLANWFYISGIADEKVSAGKEGIIRAVTHPLHPRQQGTKHFTGG
jgi:hypothetical protein